MGSIGKRICALRKEKGMKQEELAQRLDISGQAVSKWENDQTYPDVSLLPRLAEIFGVTTDYLLTGEQEQTPPVRIVPEEERKDMKDLMLRVLVESKDGDKVRVNLPMQLIQLAQDMGLELPQLSGNAALKKVDLSKVLELVRHGVIGDLVQVESKEGDTVRIFVE
jgi:transcriptional regulator with XRE-family HTH domain